MREVGCFLYDMIILNFLLFVCEDAVRMDMAVQSSRINAGLWVWILIFSLLCSLKEHPHLQ